MTGNQTDDQKAAGAGQGATPQQQPSSPESSGSLGGGPTLLPDEVKSYIDGKFDEFGKTITNQFSRVQGTVDKNSNDIRTFMDEVSKFEAAGMSRDDAIRTVEDNRKQDSWRENVDQRFADIMSLLQGSRNVAGTDNAVAQVLTEYGLDRNDPFVAARLQGQNFKSKTDIEALAGRILLEKQKSPTPSAATSPSQVGQTTGASLSQEQRDNLLIELAELTKNYTVNESRINEIQKELNSAGVAY